MQADWSVELGPDDPVLEFPWSSPDEKVRYFDIKRHPELLYQVEELKRAPELASILLNINAPATLFETAKCDVWSSDEVGADEEIFGRCKFASYIDLIFSSSAERFSFDIHERLVKILAKQLDDSSDIAAAAEFIVRRCYYHGSDGIRDAFYITIYVSGFGQYPPSARRSWVAALQPCEEAVCGVTPECL